MKNNIFLSSLLGLILVFGGSQSLLAQDKPIPGTETFWTELQKLCGKAFTETVAAAPADDTTFKDKELVMHVRACEKDRIRIPFVVGADRLRTWVLTRQKDGKILLKHDHRHEDGMPDKVTNYGGLTPNTGLPTRQVFPADQQTVDILPSAAPNVWWIELAPGDFFPTICGGWVRKDLSASNLI